MLTGLEHRCSPDTVQRETIMYLVPYHPICVAPSPISLTRRRLPGTNITRNSSISSEVSLASLLKRGNLSCIGNVDYVSGLLH